MFETNAQRTIWSYIYIEKKKTLEQFVQYKMLQEYMEDHERIVLEMFFYAI